MSLKFGQPDVSIWAIWTCKLGKPPPLGAGHTNQTSFVLLRVTPMMSWNWAPNTQFVLASPGYGETKFAESEGQSLIRMSFQKYVVPDSGNLKTRMVVPIVECPAQKTVSPAF